MTKAEKEALNAVMQEMSDGIAKSKVKVINNVDQKSVQLLAKESREAFEAMREDLEKLEAG